MAANSLLSWQMRRNQICAFNYLSRALNSLADDKENDCPGQQKAQYNPPFKATCVFHWGRWIQRGTIPKVCRLRWTGTLIHFSAVYFGTICPRQWKLQQIIIIYGLTWSMPLYQPGSCWRSRRNTKLWWRYNTAPQTGWQCTTIFRYRPATDVLYSRRREIRASFSGQYPARSETRVFLPISTLPWTEWEMRLETKLDTLELLHLFAPNNCIHHWHCKFFIQFNCPYLQLSVFWLLIERWTSRWVDGAFGECKCEQHCNS